MGLPASLAGTARQVHDVSLEPGDRILLYSDGVVESRDDAGEEFGLERFTDYIIRSTGAGQNATPSSAAVVMPCLLVQGHGLSPVEQAGMDWSA